MIPEQPYVLCVGIGLLVGDLLGMLTSYLWVVRPVKKMYIKELQAHSESLKEQVEFVRRMAAKLQTEKEEANGYLARLDDPAACVNPAFQSAAAPAGGD